MLSPITSPPPPTADSALDDDELMDDLFAQLESKDTTIHKETAVVLNQINKEAAHDPADSQKKDSKSRHKARQARKAAALAESYAPTDEAADARLTQEASTEEKTINHTCDQLGVTMHEITPDGHCLFSAIADQLNILGILPQSTTADYTIVRRAAADYIHAHPDVFVPFLPSSGGEDALGATSDTGLMKPREFEQYCATIRNTAAWGGEPEILALSRAYNIPIHVVQSGSPPVVMHNPSGGPDQADLKDKHVVRISYHRRMYGLGEHYNSLRPKTGLGASIKSLFTPS